MYNKILIISIMLLHCISNYGKDIIIKDSFKDIALPLAETPSQATIEFPAVKKEKGYTVCLSFKAYVDWRRPGGFNHYLALDLNGRNLGKETESAMPRLLKRGSFIRTSIPKYPTKDWWANINNKTSLLMFFGTGKGEIDKRVLTSRKEGYNYIIDISDAVNYIVYGADFKIDIAKPNVLTLSNMLLKKYVPDYDRKGLVVENIKVLYLSDSDMNKMRDVKIKKFKPAEIAASLKSDKFSLDITKAGGMEVKIADENYYIESMFSYPNIPKMRYNLMGLSSSTGQAGWKPAIKQISNKEVEIRVTASEYSILRKIRLKKLRIEVSDSIKNTTDESIGIKFMNNVGVNFLPKSNSYYLGGMQGAETKDFAFSSSNPTIFIKQKNSSIGIVAEDTVYRVQLSLLRKNNYFSLMDSKFGLEAKSDYTLDWAVYPIKDTKYFTFINKVRNDWNVNFTIPGPYIGAIKSYKGKSFICPGMKADVISFAPWFEWYYDRKKCTREEYTKIISKSLVPVREKFPKAKYLPKIETNLVCLDVTSFPEGDKLPVRKGLRTDPGIKYGFFLSEELSKLVDKNTNYSDALIRDEKGRVLIDNYYPGYPMINLMLQPAVGNQRYKTFLEQIDYLINKLNFDGIYVDQFIPMPVGGITYNKWDGHSVKLDESGKIIKRYYDYAIAGVSARVDITKKILDQGKIFVHNGQSVSRELQSLPAVAFQEMENDNVNPIPFMDKKPPAFKWQAACHLGSPVILGLRTVLYAKGKHKDQGAEILNKGIITALRNGVLFYNYVSVIPTSGPNAGGYGPVNNMFPFTPVEINEGFMIGKERTITCVSRTFKLNFAPPPVCLLFDKKGLPKKHDFKVSGSKGNWTIDVKLDDWNEIAIIKQ